MRYIMYGAGAIGGSLGARLAHAGRDVLLIARGDHGAALVAGGLRFRTPDENLVLRIPVVARPAEIVWQPGDVVFLTMKGQDTAAAVRELAAVAPDDLPVVCAQNGVENERVALRFFADVHGMVVKLSATYLEPGLICAYNAPMTGILDVGRYPRGVDAVDERIAADLREARCLSIADPDVMRRKYAKLLINTTNALEAAGGKAARSGPLRERVRAEAIACFRAHDIAFELGPGEDERTARSVPALIDGKPYPGNSMWQSLVRGASEDEVDLLNGEVVLLGRQRGIATPVNAALQRLVHRMVRDGAAPGSVSLERLEGEVA